MSAFSLRVLSERQAFRVWRPVADAIAEPLSDVTCRPQAREPLAIDLRQDPATRVLRADPRLHISKWLTIGTCYFQPERCGATGRQLDPALLSFHGGHRVLERHEAIGHHLQAQSRGREIPQLEEASGIGRGRRKDGASASGAPDGYARTSESDAVRREAAAHDGWPQEHDFDGADAETRGGPDHRRKLGAVTTSVPSRRRTRAYTGFPSVSTTEISGCPAAVVTATNARAQPNLRRMRWRSLCRESRREQSIRARRRIMQHVAFGWKGRIAPWPTGSGHPFASRRSTDSHRLVSPIHYRGAVHAA